MSAARRAWSTASVTRPWLLSASAMKPSATASLWRSPSDLATSAEALEHEVRLPERLVGRSQRADGERLQARIVECSRDSQALLGEALGVLGLTELDVCVGQDLQG